MSEITHSTMSFDRMRSMLMRAAEIRDSEQQQIFDALDEISARLSPLESLGSVRKRMTELPDRTEVSVLAERLDEALSKLEAQDSAIAGLSRAVEAIVDKLAKPFAELGGRLDGVAGRFEGVAGRMDGLEDRVAGLHKRIDDLDHHLDKQDVRVDALPTAMALRERLETLEGSLRGRLDEVNEGMREHVDTATAALQRSVSEAADAVGNAVTDARGELAGLVTGSREVTESRLHELATRPTVDPTAALDSLADRLQQVTGRLDSLGSRLDAVEDSVGSRIGGLSGLLEQGLDKLDGSLASRPDADVLAAVVRRANEESEMRHAGHLDEAMATFAELIMGGSGGQVHGTPPPPRSASRRVRKTTNKREAEPAAEDASA